MPRTEVVAPVNTRLHPVAAGAVFVSLEAHAKRNLDKYPQYHVGYFDTWQIRQVTKATHFKGYSEFDEGELVLCAPALTLTEGLAPTLSTYCPRTGSICAMPWENTRAIETTNL